MGTLAYRSNQAKPDVFLHPSPPSHSPPIEQLTPCCRPLPPGHARYAHLRQSDTSSLFFFTILFFHFSLLPPPLTLTLRLPPPPPPPYPSTDSFSYQRLVPFPTASFSTAPLPVAPHHHHDCPPSWVRPIFYRWPPVPSAGIQPVAAFDRGSGTAAWPSPHRKLCLRGNADFAGSAQLPAKTPFATRAAIAVVR